jgi:hypothetical protein
MEYLCQRLVEEGLANRADLRGYSSEEVCQVEAVTRQRLPEYYRAFLRAFGKGGGAFMRGTHIFMKDPSEFVLMREGAVRLMAQSKADESLSKDAFVFADHQGYQFWYFLTGNAEPDPEVFYYHENWKRPERKYACLSDCLARMLADTVADAEFLQNLKVRGARGRARGTFDGP